MMLRAKILTIIYIVLHSIANLATNAALNAKISEDKNKISSIITLATTDALTAVENKIPDVSDLANKSDYNTKVLEME